MKVQRQRCEAMLRMWSYGLQRKSFMTSGQPQLKFYRRIGTTLSIPHKDRPQSKGLRTGISNWKSTKKASAKT